MIQRLGKACFCKTWYIEYNDDTIEEDDEFSELIEYTDNQRW